MPRIVQFLNFKTIIMNYAIRRDDREPNKYSRVCCCHFRDGDKRNLPTISNRNKDKLFDPLPGAEPKPPPKKKVKTKSDAKLPPSLNCGKFTESEARATKSIARCRVHVERANARLKSFRILGFIPSFLQCHADTLHQLCAALVNPHFPLIKDGCNDFEFD